MAFHCAIKNCSNGAYRLSKWKSQECHICGCHHADKGCKCAPPFRLYPFPTKRKDKEKRERWKQLVGRKTGSKLWSPSKDSRICSEHFEDGEPTIKNPMPTLNLGYSDYKKRVQRISFFGIESAEDKSKSKKKKVKSYTGYDDVLSICKESPTEEQEDPPVERIVPRKSIFEYLWPWIIWVLSLLLQLRNNEKEIFSLKKENSKLKETVKEMKAEKTLSSLKTDEDFNFHTGLKSLTIFNKLHDIIAPLVNRRWTGVSSLIHGVRKFKKKPCRFGPERKLSSRCEFLLTLMKLRLGLLNNDLARRFDISSSLCSRVFFTWLRACSKALRHLVYIPDQETLIATKPNRYRSLPDLHSIIDCTEIFIETPKDLYLQGATWSDYKHHNTVKFLIACTPNSFISYVSPVYTGRISDKALTADCGFLEKLPPHSMVMADKGFNISDLCATNMLSLRVPPGKRGHSQMTTDAVRKTKRIANHRILIEQVIRRVKTFRKLASEIPLSL